MNKLKGIEVIWYNHNRIYRIEHGAWIFAPSQIRAILHELSMLYIQPPLSFPTSPATNPTAPHCTPTATTSLYLMLDAMEWRKYTSHRFIHTRHRLIDLLEL